jgi:DNA replication and repair protein RecF
MALRRLQVSDFRCVQAAELAIDPKFTLIVGQNASGKTSLLEAIYVLSRGRSFRTRRVNNLIRTSTSRFVVFGEVERGGERVPLGVEGTAEGMRARMAGERVGSLSDLTVAVGSWIGVCSTWNIRSSVIGRSIKLP